MKNLQYLKFTSVIILICLVSLSCGTTRKMALSCPDPARQPEHIAALNHPRSIKKIQVASKRNSKRDNSFTMMDTHRYTVKPDKVIDTRAEYNKKAGTGLVQSVAPDDETASLPVIPGADYDDTCVQVQDTLYLKDGTKVAGKLVEKSKKEYRLQSSDGRVYIFTSDFVEKVVPDTVVTPASQRKENNSDKTERLSLAGFITGFAGWLSPLILWFMGSYGLLNIALILILPACALASLIMSVSALIRMKKNPGMYKKRGWAIGGLFFGIGGIISVLMILLLMLMAAQ